MRVTATIMFALSAVAVASCDYDSGQPVDAGAQAGATSAPTATASTPAVTAPDDPSTASGEGLRVDISQRAVSGTVLPDGAAPASMFVLAEDGSYAVFTERYEAGYEATSGVKWSHDPSNPDEDPVIMTGLPPAGSFLPLESFSIIPRGSGAAIAGVGDDIVIDDASGLVTNATIPTGERDGWTIDRLRVDETADAVQTAFDALPDMEGTAIVNDVGYHEIDEAAVSKVFPGRLVFPGETVGRFTLQGIWYSRDTQVLVPASHDAIFVYTDGFDVIVVRNVLLQGAGTLSADELAAEIGDPFDVLSEFPTNPPRQGQLSEPVLNRYTVPHTYGYADRLLVTAETTGGIDVLEAVSEMIGDFG